VFRPFMKRGRDAVRGEDDRRLFDGADLFDRAHAELLHLVDDALVVNDLAEDRAAAAGGCETLHFEVGDANPRAESVLLGAFDLHGRGNAIWPVNILVSGVRRRAPVLPSWRLTPEPRRPQEPLFTPAFAGLWVYAFVTFFSAFQLPPAI